METEIIQIKDTILKIFSFFDRGDLIHNKEKFLNKIIEDIKNNSNSEGFAGFQNESGFRMHFDFRNYGDKINIKYPSNKIFLNKISKLTKEALEKISEVLDKREIHLYLFPTLSKFTIEKMKGSSGRWIWKNVIYIDVFPGENWEEYFKGTLIHETAHTLSDYYSNEISIGEGIIFEGLAEHFQEKFIGVKNSWTKAFPKKKIQEIFKEIKANLDKKDHDLYNDLFFGTGKYPLWTGYTIGYFLIEEYLKKHKKFSWKKLLRENPNKILKEIVNR